MEVFYFLAAFLLVRRLQKSIKTSFALYPKWRTLLISGMWIIAGLYLLSIKLFDDPIAYFAGTAILSGLIYYGKNEADFVSQQSYIYANIPLAVVGFINGLAMLVVPGFYDKWESYFFYASIAAFMWIFGRWAVSKKQSEELRINAERRAELEALVQERTAELSKQKDELQEVVSELKSTQAQLIQSEKMASLGELTAGIAHEIQNPLNFVNNFSDVSVEMLEEMEQELNKGDIEEALAIAADVKQNLGKIIHHGKRADSIVKGMLQHSRAGSTTKELTDINLLADEYLRLAYHGLRAKDKTFNADLITNYAPNLPKINLLPQDIGRVLLNLFSNAFYAVQQRQRLAADAYKPTLELSTLLNGKMMVIRVKDNGAGIPEKIKDKIMQPFFTTKPTGEGTGLGLSLSYDIVVKAHGGKIDIETKEGEFTIFTVWLPLL